MNDLVSVPISPWYAVPAAVGLLALTFGFTPGVLLHLGVLLYPKGHERRRQFVADLYDVAFLKRPFWVAGILVRCLFEGVPARIELVRADGTERRRRKTPKPAHLGKGVVALPPLTDPRGRYLDPRDRLPWFLLTTLRRVPLLRGWMRRAYLAGARDAARRERAGA